MVKFIEVQHPRGAAGKFTIRGNTGDAVKLAVSNDSNPGCDRCGVHDAVRNADGSWGFCAGCRSGEGNPGCDRCGVHDAIRNEDGTWGYCAGCRDDA